ncbi:phosphopyruvate hydratase [Sulfurisphaera tokodaii]|uniref:Enolase n=2 Tax=Sulfurisphaera tokodaii TaxID=111955 RepID=ENO_SULTO|nr:phosphopyruvate hydratase [Sulfurisphaera tokodaii]Q972B6.1 RecName: Full=Enolase; AltName: Full=2-phospho-D-glycerate hydro-lyase; AltName: Full=2-phosphoglycerate dehydratase [Sulfurisphaera tokodaii str. 7]BAB66253.1 enolase [Sulfurisphaera tokodaii str. 7]HII73232.1 phosphopyruvate hydratase [Sulfurisphaera tokodaii]
MNDYFRIKKIKGYQILDSRGNKTIRVKIETYGGISETGDAPAGASKGSREAIELRDKDGGVTRAVELVNTLINDSLRDFDVRNQLGIDQTLIRMDGTPNKSRVGGNTTIATSIAVAKTAAKAMGLEIFQYIGGPRVRYLPIPLLNILNGGLHAGNELKIQEFIIIPLSFDSFHEALYAADEVYKQLKGIITEKYGKLYTMLGDEGGVAPPLSKTEDALDLVYTAIKNSGYEDKIVMGIDAASSDFFNGSQYEIDGKKLSPDEMIDYYIQLASRYPLLYIEDPFNENDFERFSILQQKLKKTIVTGDDLFTTNIEYLKKGIEKSSAKGTIVKPNQIGTLSETFEYIEFAKKNSIKIIVSHRSGETEDSFIADLAVGVQSDFIKTGAPARGERTSKYNRLLEIENDYGIEYYGKKIYL